MIEAILNFINDPIWAWAFLSLGILAISSAIAWFFEPFRTYAGLVIIATIAMLVAYRKGEVDKAKQLKKREVPRSNTPIEDIFKPWPR